MEIIWTVEKVTYMPYPILFFSLNKNVVRIVKPWQWIHNGSREGYDVLHATYNPFLLIQIDLNQSTMYLVPSYSYIDKLRL